MFQADAPPCPKCGTIMARPVGQITVYRCLNCGHEMFTGKEEVNHPDHYGGGDNPYEAIKVIEAWRLGFHLGNSVKYICRAGKKGNVLRDLKKAEWYLQRKIAQLESQSENKREEKTQSQKEEKAGREEDVGPHSP